MLFRSKIGIISKINDKEIRTMDDLRKVLYKYRNSYYNIEFESGKKIILSDVNKKARTIDKELLEEYFVEIFSWTVLDYFLLEDIHKN